MFYLRVLAVFVVANFKLIAQTAYTKSGDYKHGLAKVYVERRPALVRYEDAEPVRKYGLVNIAGDLIADTIYDYVSDINDDGIAVLVKGDRIGVIDASGHIISPFVFRTDKLYWPEPSFHDGLLPVLSLHNADNQWYSKPRVGFINGKGRLVIDTVFDLDNATGDRLADFNRAKMAGGMCGTGMHRASVYAHEHPYYLKAGYYEFGGGRCLASKGRTNVVIDRKGREVYKIKCYVNRADNLDGYIKVDSTQPYSWSVEDGQAAGPADAYYDKWGAEIKAPHGTEIELMWRGHLVVRTPSKEYQFIDPATGKRERGKTFKYVSVRMDGGLNTDRGVLEE